MNAIELLSTKNLSREQWLQIRKQGIGGSDAAAVCGLSRWKSPVDLWLDKTGELDPEPSGEAAYWGTLMEPIVRQEFSRRTGLHVEEHPYVMQHPEHPFMLSNIDGLIEDPKRGLGVFEAKTANAFARPDWESGLPDEYALQVQHYLGVTGLSFAWVAVLIGGNTFETRLVERNEPLIRDLIVLEKHFWDGVLNLIPPVLDGSDASSRLLNRLYPESASEKTIQLPDEALRLIGMYEEAQQSEKDAANRKEESANRLKALMGDAETAQAGDRLVTWKSIQSERLNTKALKAEEPGLYEKYLSCSSYRRFSIK